MTDDRIRILGIDPGLETTGIGILDIKRGDYYPVYSDCIITKKSKPICERLEEIYTVINQLIKKYCPDCLVVEEIFFNINIKCGIINFLTSFFTNAPLKLRCLT